MTLSVLFPHSLNNPFKALKENSSDVAVSYNIYTVDLELENYII